MSQLEAGVPISGRSLNRVTILPNIFGCGRKFAIIKFRTTDIPEFQNYEY